jgi:hypothetical protein
VCLDALPHRERKSVLDFIPIMCYTGVLSVTEGAVMRRSGCGSEVRCSEMGSLPDPNGPRRAVPAGSVHPSQATSPVGLPVNSRTGELEAGTEVPLAEATKISLRGRARSKPELIARGATACRGPWDSSCFRSAPAECGGAARSAHPSRVFRGKPKTPSGKRMTRVCTYTLPLAGEENPYPRSAAWAAARRAIGTR